ncbi:hypothetical protein EII22_08875 [Coriobacteriales bacterium OH1046]|nr:hypothetical protein EII22_08875 [Coriobacteriales bacterium OH1046]
MSTTLSMVPIPGFEDTYSATDAGTIYSHRARRELKAKRHSNGYLAVCLVDKNGVYKDFLVHRLVCLAYHGAPEQHQTDVNHIDHIKSDNRPENLEWCTRSENMRAAIAFGAMDGQRKAVSRSNAARRKPVIGSDKGGNDLAWFESVTEARMNGYAKVSDVLLGNRKTAGGLFWRYA